MKILKDGFDFDAANKRKKANPKPRAEEPAGDAPTSPPGEFVMMAIDEIDVSHHHRREMDGDKPGQRLSDLESTIADEGMNQVIVVNSLKQLISGRRRLEVLRKQGVKEVPVRIRPDLDDPVRATQAELSDNACRKPYTKSELTRLGMTLEQQLAEEARKRQQEGGQKAGRGRPGRKVVPNLVQAILRRRKETTDDLVARAIGVGREQFRKMKKLVQAADEDPDLYGDLVREMDTTNKVDKVYQELVRRQTDPRQDEQQDEQQVDEDVEPPVDEDVEGPTRDPEYTIYGDGYGTTPDTHEEVEEEEVEDAEDEEAEEQDEQPDHLLALDAEEFAMQIGTMQRLTEALGGWPDYTIRRLRGHFGPETTAEQRTIIKDHINRLVVVDRLLGGDGVNSGTDTVPPGDSNSGSQEVGS
jgi:ParB-like chromosome segregation protein Spo0J